MYNAILNLQVSDILLGPYSLPSSAALSGLTAASYREDQYGSVQRDIPKVIECLLACLMATESYLQRPPLGPAAGGIKTNPHQVLMREPHAMVQGMSLPYIDLVEVRAFPCLANIMSLMMRLDLFVYAHFL